MDINSLLSPSETPRSVSSTPNSPKASPFKYVQRTQSGPGPSKHGPGASPLSQTVMNQSSIPAHVLSPDPQQVSSPLISPVPTTNSGQLARTTSTHSIETINDLASAQNLQMKSASAHLRGRDGFDMSRSPSLMNPAVTAALTSNPRASFDINMMETPKQVVRTNFSDSSLNTDQQTQLSELANEVQDNPSSYEAHVATIKILHDGFIDHIYPPNDSTTRREPRNYDLLGELRGARENMEKLFAVGEKLWIDWLQDESILARTAEERIAVVEKCRKAVEEEVGSIPLWLAYGDWVRHCYEWAHDQVRSSDALPDEERLVGREIFTWQLVLDTWQEAVDQTALNLTQSHLVWNKYLAIRLPNLQQKASSDEVSTAIALFEGRLQTPHAAWDETFQAFSSFVSANFDSEQYETIMSEMLRSAASAKKTWTAREPFESAIEQAEKIQDRDAEYHALTKYIEWEQTPERRKKLDPELIDTLFRRAELRFPTDATLWEEHITFLLGQPKSVLLPVLERATKHCPWSGSLWSQYLLSSDRAGQAFHETEAIKHKATSTGLLEAAGIEEVIKVHGAWCSYLRRRSFRPDGNEEDLDVAEMGIRSSIENVASLAAKLSLGGVSDPAFRLHRIYIVFLSESGRWDNARQEFDNSVRDYGDSYEFWMMFYNWEMGRWRRFASNQQSTPDEHLSNTAPPHLATAVLKKALDQPSLDYPEPIMQALMTHCEDFEDADELQSAMLKVKKVQKTVSVRRQVEAAMAAEREAVQSAGTSDIPTMAQNSLPSSLVVPETSLDPHPTSAHSVKRKRDEEDVDASNKKSRNVDAVHETVEPTDISAPKRDRENATVLVENLSEDITDTQIRQYFSNCGPVRSLKVLREDGVSAVVEFEDDEAARYALSRDEQDLNGAIISVSLDTGSTLYLTNYKPSADENYVRNLMEEHGEILSIRFPSLQGNKKRRFCYIQFKSPTQAQAASAAVDGKSIDDYTLVCKISNPARRKVRDEVNVNDGHTVFVGQLNFKATEDEVKTIFSAYGTIEKIRMPLHPTLKSRNKGIAYITYQSIGEAEKAVSVMNGAAFQERSLTVELASNRAKDARKRESQTRSMTPIRNGEGSVDGRELAARRDCQVFLTNVPDTINQARLREIAQSYGKITRVILKTNHQGAILEFSTASEAGQASLKLDTFEIVPGRQMRVVSESQMLSNTREVKSEGFAPAKAKPKPVAAAPFGGIAPVRRPVQPNVRKGGNLGQRNIALHQANNKQDNQGNGEGADTKKTNDDFRAMLKKTDS